MRAERHERHGKGRALRMLDGLPQAAVFGALKCEFRAVCRYKGLAKDSCELSPGEPVNLLVPVLVLVVGPRLLNRVSLCDRLWLRLQANDVVRGGLLRTVVSVASTLKLVVLPHSFVARAIRRDQRAITVELAILFTAVVPGAVIPENRHAAVPQVALAEFAGNAFKHAAAVEIGERSMTRYFSIAAITGPRDGVV